MEVNFKAHILNHQDGHPQAILPEALTLRLKGCFGKSIRSLLHLLPPLLGISRVTEKPSSTLRVP